MQFLDKWERKLGWMSFPGLLRYYALFHVLVFLLQYINPGIERLLEFDRSKIMAGEVWRLVTFIFATDRFGGPGAFAMLFLFFMVMIAFMISDALEQAWGVFRSSLFFYAGYLGLLVANVIYPQTLPGSGFFIYLSAFFVFCTLFPKYEFLMFFVIPVQVRWLGMFLAGMLVLGVIGSPLYLGFLFLGFANYIFWAGIPALRGRAQLAESAARRKKFDKSKPSAEVAFHKCATCSRTEISDPGLDFRMAVDGNEYCEEHLPEG
ncbi:hypothetical protein [Luteolibacter sp. AS25]|uniref:hypothetical protein n=1 Tax=Luteolibacter sp. AS25 TaxID=3135776 RepID=UPI00398B1E45